MATGFCKKESIKDAFPYFFSLIIPPTDPPTVSVHLANEDPSRVVTRSEGDNVTLKCRADARPPVSSFGWIKNVSTDWEFWAIKLRCTSGVCQLRSSAMGSTRLA